MVLVPEYYREMRGYCHEMNREEKELLMGKIFIENRTNKRISTQSHSSKQ